MANLSLIQQQKLQAKLSPTQIQVIKLLEVPACELQQRVNEELQENPALEEGRDPEELQEEQFEKDLFGEEDDYKNPLQTEDFNYDEYVNDDETPDYMLRSYNGSDDTDQSTTSYTGGTTLAEYLKSQVYLTKMTKEQRHIAKWVLGNIDEDGFLRRTTEQLVDDLAFQEGLTVSDEEMADIVRQIKEFDPPGVAAQDLQECLITQLKAKIESEPSHRLETALALLTRCFNDFSHHRYERIKERLKIDEDELKEAIDEVIHLNQKPANAFIGNTYESRQTTIIPDFYVEDRNGELILTLNTGDVPELHVNQDYIEMLKSYSQKSDARSQKGKDKEVTNFIRGKLDAARWFIDALRQRNETLTRTMSAIIQQQREFFLSGDDLSLKPMILQDIANITGYDISTISRVCNSKYVQTDYGIFPLRHFFSDTITNGEGEEISTREIKKIISEVIANEDKATPLLDDQLADVLIAKGYKIARRTVAKYREQLGIPVARLRQTIV